MIGIDRVRTSVAQFGVPNTLRDLALRATNRVVLLKVIKGVSIGRVDPAFLKCPEPYRPMFLDEPSLREFSRDPACGISGTFLDEALAKGDECYGIIDGDGRLAAYGWYARTPTRIDPPDLMLSFGNRYVYMYKGYTDVRHRGRRLHAIGMARALEHYLAQGYRGLVSYVESNNFSSLKSVFRMGYAEFGSIEIVKIFGRYVTHASSGCRSWDFRITPVGLDPREGGGHRRHYAD